VEVSRLALSWLKIETVGRGRRGREGLERNGVDERVLFVEDDPSIREVASLGLRGAGLGVETAANGR
jgi:hypothetical protein